MRVTSAILIDSGVTLKLTFGIDVLEKGNAGKPEFGDSGLTFEEEDAGHSNPRCRRRDLRIGVQMATGVGGWKLPALQSSHIHCPSSNVFLNSNCVIPIHVLWYVYLQLRHTNA